MHTIQPHGKYFPNLLVIIFMAVMLVFFQQTGNVISYKITLSAFFILSAAILLALLLYGLNKISLPYTVAMYTLFVAVTVAIMLVNGASHTNTAPVKTIFSGYLTYLSTTLLLHTSGKHLFKSHKWILIALLAVVAIIAVQILFSARITVINGFLFNTTLYSNLLSLFVVFCFYLKSHYQQHEQINLVLNVLIVAFFAVALIDGARIAIAICLLALVVYLNARYKFTGRNKTLTALLFCAVVALALYFKQGSTNGRLLIWKTSLRVISDNPAGIGAGNFANVYNTFQSDYLNSPNASKQELLNADTDEYAFNDLLQITAESGIFASLCYLLVIGIFFYHIKNVYGKVLIVAWVLLSLFSYPLYVYIINVTFNVFLAYFVYKYAHSGSVSTIGWPLKFTAVALLAVFILNEVLNLYAYTAWNSLQKNGYGSFEKLPSLAQKRLLSDNSFIYSYGVASLSAKKYNKALHLLGANTNNSFDTDLNIAIAMCAENLNDYANAERYYKKAIYINPIKFAPKSYLLDFYLKHDTTKARSTAVDIVNTPVKVRSFFIDSLKQQCNKLFNIN